MAGCPRYAVPGLLAEQLIRPVRFDKVMARFAELGITTFVEIGPGRVTSPYTMCLIYDPSTELGHNLGNDGVVGG